MRFYNRETELNNLQKAWNSSEAQFVLLYGRRRVGKTYLLQHFLDSDHPHCYYLAAQTSLADNISQLAEAVIRYDPDSELSVNDLPTFRSILAFLDRLAKKTRFALVIDEFQYLIEQDKSIPSQLQAWWDTKGIRSNIFLVLCGSHLGIMENLGGSQAPLFGRFTMRKKLAPMSYLDTLSFHAESNYSVRDLLTTYAILGGTPKYHASFDPDLCLDDNIVGTIMSPSGIFHNEPEILISSSQVRDPSPYNGVLAAIAGGCSKSNEISQRVGIATNNFHFFAKTLTEWEWIIKEYPFKTTSDSRSIYKINDHFLHYWYRFVLKLRSDLIFNDPKIVYEARVKPYINQYIGQYAFENICWQYIKKHGAQLFGELIRDGGRFWTRDGKTELDIVCEQDNNRLIVGECKWSSSPLDVTAYYELREKAATISGITRSDIAVYILFSLAGFDENLYKISERENLFLITGEDLVHRR